MYEDNPLEAGGPMNARRLAYAAAVLTAMFATVTLARDAAAEPRKYVFETILPPGAGTAFAHGVNDAGQVVGLAIFFETGSVRDEAFHFDGANYTSIKLVPGLTTQLYGINNLGEIIGSSQVFPTFRFRGFLISGGNIVTLSASPAGGNTIATALNNHGAVVGYFCSNVDCTTPIQGFLLEGGVYTSLTLPGTAGRPVFPEGINDSGEIAGFVGGNLPEEAFLLDSHGSTSFAIPGALATRAHGIDNCSRVAGTFVDANGTVHGFLKDGKKLTVIDVPGATMTQVLGISPSTGQLVGYFSIGPPGPGGQGQIGFLATPAHGRSLECRKRRQ